MARSKILFLRLLRLKEIEKYLNLNLTINGHHEIGVNVSDTYAYAYKKFNHKKLFLHLETRVFHNTFLLKWWNPSYEQVQYFSKFRLSETYIKYISLKDARNGVPSKG